MHPAAKLIVLASKSQEQECGDATNFVVSFAGELLQKAEELLKEGIHANDILKGYELARNKALEMYTPLKVWSCTDIRKVEEVQKGVQTAIAAKEWGNETP